MMQSRSAHKQLCLPAPSASAPICRPGENHLSWALPCSAHVAVSLMKLVLQHLPYRPSCTKGRRSIKRVKSIEGTAAPAHHKLLSLAYRSLHTYLGICLLRYYAAISSHECDRPHPCPACALSLAWICVWRPSSKSHPPDPNAWCPSIITHGATPWRLKEPGGGTTPALTAITRLLCSLHSTTAHVFVLSCCHAARPVSPSAAHRFIPNRTIYNYPPGLP